MVSGVRFQVSRWRWKVVTTSNYMDIDDLEVYGKVYDVNNEPFLKSWPVPEH